MTVVDAVGVVGEDVVDDGDVGPSVWMTMPERIARADRGVLGNDRVVGVGASWMP
jgi:hypothetical protein